jgi:transcriptional repressor NrdR
MVCIYCRHETQVINSRLQKRANQVWRRRKCLQCHTIFSSLEAVNWDQAVRFKRQGRLEPFSRDQLFLSLYEACRHRKTARNDATALTDTVLNRLWPRLESASLTREQVISVTSEVLKRFDRAAQVQYLAFHPIKQ